MVDLGGALLSGLFNVLFDRLTSKEVLNFFRGKKIFAELLFELKTRLASANKLSTDAEEKQLGDENVKKWLDELRDILYAADHALDKINTESLRRRIQSNEQSSFNIFKLLVPSSLTTMAFENTLKREVEEILRKLKVLLDQSSHLGLKEHNNREKVSHERLLSPLIEESDVCGRKAEKEAIVAVLLSDKGEKITVVPIVGMAGIGKTTLARLVYNDAEVQDHFDKKAWVIVSENFDVHRITRTILEIVTEIKPESEDSDKIRSDLKMTLKGKKFLIVLDDVWCENYDVWDVLRSSLNSGEQGSKIIVTTRSKITATNMGNVPLHDLQVISQDDCLNLFKKHIGFSGNETSGPQSELLEIGIEIVKKCKGLPLAVKSIAGVLRSVLQPEEWRRILQSDIWELKNTNILPALWLSYQFLPPNLKRCFAYFSVFPKDYEFDLSERERLILIWMAEGLIQQENGKRMEDIGKEYLNALISRSFFQRSSRNESTLLMHDLLHDLAICISGEFSFKLGNNSEEIRNKVRHFLYPKNSKDLGEKLEGLYQAKKLRTFLALPLSTGASSCVDSGLSEKAFGAVLGANLRVFSLSGSSVSELRSDSFESLVYLRYLDLSNTKLEKVPDSVCVLYNLQTLLLSNCENLTALPANTRNLINLRNLDVRGTPLKAMPPRLEQLKALQTLSDFVLGNFDGERLKELGELRNLHGSLRISGLENVAESWDVSTADLKSKQSLTEVILSWEGETDDSRKEREVLSDLRPHESLKELEIDGFRGTTFPEWLGNPASHDMAKITISRCKNCVMLPPLGQLPRLAELRVQENEWLVSVGDEFLATDSPSNDAFSSLKTLSFDGMTMWRDWCFTKAITFPSLTNLHLEFCKKLKIALPLGSFPSLKTVRIVNCRSMKTVFPTSSRAQIDSSFPSLEALQIRRCPRLEFFSKTGLPSSLRNLEIFDDCELLFENRMDWDLQSLSKLQRLELSGCKRAIQSFPEEGLLPNTLTRLRIDSFRRLERLNGDGFRGLTELRQLSICECDRLMSLPEQGLPNSLSYLRMVRCPLLSQRCRRNVGEDWDKISHIPLIIVNREEI